MNIFDLIPLWTRQATLGGSNPANFLITKFSMFMGSYWNGQRLIIDDPVIFNRSLSKMSLDDLKSYLELYNVSEVVVWSRKSHEILTRLNKLFIPEKKMGEFTLYKVNIKPGWFAVGSGDLILDYDKLEIHRASKGHIILKSHWIKTFKSNPPVPIRPTYLKDDPVPFIAIDNSIGAKDIEIYNAGL